jgi:hypothetical protein
VDLWKARLTYVAVTRVLSVRAAACPASRS